MTRQSPRINWNGRAAQRRRFAPHLQPLRRLGHWQPIDSIGWQASARKFDFAARFVPRLV
jgi:hypothetical protein